MAMMMIMTLVIFDDYHWDNKDDKNDDLRHDNNDTKEGHVACLLMMTIVDHKHNYNDLLIIMVIMIILVLMTKIVIMVIMDDNWDGHNVGTDF